MRRDTETPTRRHVSWLPGAAVLVASLVVVSNVNVWPHRFFLDDMDVLREVLTRRGGLAPFGLIDPTTRAKMLPTYRPLRDITFRVDDMIWGVNPDGFALTNVLMYAVAAMLVGWAVSGLFPRRERRWGVVLSAMLFAAHPTHAEAVSWLKNRGSILVCIAGLIAVRLIARPHGRTTRHPWTLGLALLALFSAALLSSEWGVGVPLVAGAVWLAGWRDRRTAGGTPSVSVVVSGVAAVAAFVVLMSAFRAAIKMDDPANVPNLMVWPGWRVVLAMLCVHLRSLIWPVGLGMDMTVLSPSTFGGWGWGLAAAALACTACFGSRPMSTGAGWLLAGLLPMCVIVVGNRVFAEHRLLFAGAGFVLIVAAICLTASGPRRSAVAAAFCLIIVYSTGLMQRNFVWKDELRMCRGAIRRDPACAKLYHLLPMMYGRMGCRLRAIHAFNRYFSLVGNSRDLHIYRGLARDHLWAARLCQDAGMDAGAGYHREAARRLKTQPQSRNES